MILAGFALALIVILASILRYGRGGSQGGAVVIIGPLPIIFGSDKKSVRILLTFSIALVVLLIVLFLIQYYL